MAMLGSAVRHHRRLAILASLGVLLTALGGVFFVRSVAAPDTGLIRYDPEIVVRDGAVLFFPSAPFTRSRGSRRAAGT